MLRSAGPFHTMKPPLKNSASPLLAAEGMQNFTKPVELVKEKYENATYLRSVWETTMTKAHEDLSEPEIGLALCSCTHIPCSMSRVMSHELEAEAMSLVKVDVGISAFVKVIFPKKTKSRRVNNSEADLVVLVFVCLC